nr:putative ribonuclease H-like domain-containing protein [Tanacetum cinerariifolium]
MLLPPNPNCLNGEISLDGVYKTGSRESTALRINYAISFENGNSFNPVPRITANADSTSTSTISGPVTTEEKAQKKNNVKARSMLLMTLPSEHLLTFSQYKDAKILFESIQEIFGGNDATKKTQKTLLKHMYENFNDPSTESSTLSLTGCRKFTNEVDTASIQVSTASTPVSIVSSLNNTANLSDATVYAFLSNQPNGSQLVHEDLEQIHEDDLEEMDLKWSDTAGYDKTKVECFNCHKMGHFAMECRSPRNQESRPKNQDSLRKTVIVEDTSSKAMVAIDGAGFDWSYLGDDEVPTNMAHMAFSDLEGDPQVALRDTIIFDSGCSWHMAGNKSFLSYYQDYDGGFVAFASSSKGGKITDKGKIRTGKLDFEDVYFMKELKFNLFSVSKMCDKKNSVFFTKTECHILSPDFRLPDENQVLLKILYMDLFGPTFIKSIMGKMYYLVVTDDYSRFSWVFFLAKKDETCGILKAFIIGIENQLNHKVKIIRFDNGTEFKNYEMNQLCGIKGIKREFSNARTP